MNLKQIELIIVCLFFLKNLILTIKFVFERTKQTFKMYPLGQCLAHEYNIITDIW